MSAALMSEVVSRDDFIERSKNGKYSTCNRRATCRRKSYSLLSVTQGVLTSFFGLSMGIDVHENFI